MSKYHIKKLKREPVNQNFACVLDEHEICDYCGECNLCDLDKGKVCDNCGKCLNEGDYNGIIIEKIILPKPD
ncbi:hypothetical protein V6C27_04145 [Peptococcaceae bacterium 1198_IL3148]